MSVLSPSTGVGGLLRDWRQRRRLSQLDLAIEAEVSARHLSFVETGRSKPSRELVLHLAEHLDVPLRERNGLLLAAGYAPVYPARHLDSIEMAPVRDALDKVLGGHEPFPAVVVDRRWDLVAANATAMALLSTGVAPALLEPPVNTLRVSLHPDGLAPRIVNLAEYSNRLISRLIRHASVAADADLLGLAEELSGFPGVCSDSSAGADAASLIFSPLVLRGPGDVELAFFSTIATFGTALDVTLAELAIESFFPADHATTAAMAALATSREG